MTDTSTSKTWSAANAAMKVEFMEQNFTDRIRNRLLTIKQTSGYTGYVGKFRELNRVAQVDVLTAMDVFLNGLSDVNMKREIIRKKPANLDVAIQEGFVEWNLKEKTNSVGKSSKGKGKGKGDGNFSSLQVSFPKNAARKSNDNGKRPPRVTMKYSFCKRGYHKVEDCWVKFPDKRPKSPATSHSNGLDKKIYALLERLVLSDDELTAEIKQASNE
ncbi:hypothetical protein AM588_10002362 [Phytophthora nicotianae]|uniref:Retrotransposon gag domain-containing protein n=1 Tax=Phytophthora nicotianae TaxID=4792 RepID=A0A0W8CRV4_PHYNI|nr:hypothetical protein AM588_10002362 [Phytophthora nicotianae]